LKGGGIKACRGRRRLSGKEKAKTSFPGKPQPEGKQDPPVKGKGTTTIDGGRKLPSSKILKKDRKVRNVGQRVGGNGRDCLREKQKNMNHTQSPAPLPKPGE